MRVAVETNDYLKRRFVNISLLFSKTVLYAFEHCVKSLINSLRTEKRQAKMLHKECRAERVKTNSVFL